MLETIRCVALVTPLLAAAGLLSGCGHCDGAVRLMRAQDAEWCPGGLCTKDVEPHLDLPQPVAIAPDETFDMRADGPLARPPELHARSGVTGSSWVLLDSEGKPVEAEVLAGSGGHMCLNGVHFTLKPRQELAPGDYTLVLYLDEVRWPLVDGGEEGEPRTRHAGRPAVVRRYRVSASETTTK